MPVAIKPKTASPSTDDNVADGDDTTIGNQSPDAEQAVVLPIDGRQHVEVTIERRFAIDRRRGPSGHTTSFDLFPHLEGGIAAWDGKLESTKG